LERQGYAFQSAKLCFKSQAAAAAADAAVVVVVVVWKKPYSGNY
jgi:hypothetical protein